MFCITIIDINIITAKIIMTLQKAVEDWKKAIGEQYVATDPNVIDRYQNVGRRVGRPHSLPHPGAQRYRQIVTADLLVH